MRSLASLMLCCSVLVASVGCTSVAPAVAKVFPGGKSSGPIVDILALWQPGEGRDANGLPTRGFAGQVFFFAAGSKEPVPVAGDVSIVIFDDQGSAEEQSTPLHEFHFRDGVWNELERTSNVGTSYQVFVPYTRAGDHRASCSLRLKYQDAQVGVVLSKPATVVLAGSDDAIPERPPAQIVHKQITPSKMKAEKIDFSSLRQTPKDWRELAAERAQRLDASAKERRAFLAAAEQEKESETRATSAGSFIEQTSYTLAPKRPLSTESLRSTESNSARPNGQTRQRVYKIPLD